MQTALKREHLLPIGNSRTDTCVRTLRANEPLVFEGDEARELFEVTEGIIRVYKLTQDGRRQIMAFAFPGDFIGLGQPGVFTFNCDALVFSRVRVIPRRNIGRMLRENPELGEHLIDLAFREASAARELSIVLCRTSAMEKVASFLCSLAERRRTDGSFGVIRLPMTRADIADYLGLSIETVSRNITKLRTSGIISLPRVDAVQIHDMERLRAICGRGTSLH